MSETPNNTSHEPQPISAFMPDVIDQITAADAEKQLGEAYDHHAEAFSDAATGSLADAAKNAATHVLADKSRYWLETHPPATDK